MSIGRALAEENDRIATQLAATNQTIDYVRGLPAATSKKLMLDQRPRYGGEFVKSIEPWQYFLHGSMHEGMQAGRAGHGGPREDDMIIEVGLASVLWNQGLSNGWGQSAGQRTKYMRGDKEFRSRGWENGINE